MELFEACQQQPSDLARKEMCRSRLQQDINRVYAGVYGILCSFLALGQENYSPSVSLAVGRLYLTGSSMNGLGCRSSDADLCLVIKGNVSNAARHTHVDVTRPLNPLFFSQKKPNPIHVLSVLQTLFKSLREYFSSPFIILKIILLSQSDSVHCVFLVDVTRWSHLPVETGF